MTYQTYVLGFLFDKKCTKVALIQKLKPDWQAGKYNGIGGKREKNESSYNTMQREFLEETGVNINSWNKFATLHFKDGTVECFRSISDKIDNVTTTTPEPVKVFELDELPKNILPNLKWIIPLALDNSVGYTDSFDVNYLDPIIAQGFFS